MANNRNGNIAVNEYLFEWNGAPPAWDGSIHAPPEWDGVPPVWNDSIHAPELEDILPQPQDGVVQQRFVPINKPKLGNDVLYCHWCNHEYTRANGIGDCCSQVCNSFMSQVSSDSDQEYYQDDQDVKHAD